MPDNERFRWVHPIDGHPVPFDQDEINELWSDLPGDDDPPSVHEAHEKYVRTIAKWGDWNVLRVAYPFGVGDVVFFNGAFGEGFKINDEEGSWHEFVNLFAEIVENEGDCRDADYSSSLMASGYYDQQCESCYDSWLVG